MSSFLRWPGFAPPPLLTYLGNYSLILAFKDKTSGAMKNDVFGGLESSNLGPNMNRVEIKTNSILTLGPWVSSF